MALYCGIDLHSKNHYLVVLNQELKPVVERRAPNDLEKVLARLEPHREELVGVAVESTYNWLAWGTLAWDPRCASFARRRTVPTPAL